MSFDLSQLTKREFNVGTRDQKIRLGAAAGVMLVASILESGLLMLIGVAVAVLALMKWCPAYSTMGKSTVEAGDKPPIL